MSFSKNYMHSCVMCSTFYCFSIIFVVSLFPLARIKISLNGRICWLVSNIFRSIEHSSLVQGCWNVSYFEGPLASHKIPIFNQCFLFILMRKKLWWPIDPSIPDGPAYLEDFSRKKFLQRSFSCKFFRYVSKYVCTCDSIWLETV